MMKKIHNANKTCWNCPSAIFKGNVDFRACGQSKEKVKELQSGKSIVIECSRRKELGRFEPTITFEQCPEWELNKEYNLYFLKKMKVMILGIDGYLGWALALRLGNLGFQVSGVDNFLRRDCVAERGSHTAVPIERMTDRLRIAKDIFGIDINFRKMDILDREKLKEFLEEVRPESIVHYAEIPSAPFSMIDADHAIETQKNNVLGTLGLLFLIRDVVPEANLVKLGTAGEYGAMLTGRPIFEGIFPADAVLKWEGKEWSLGGEITPRDPTSFYHCSKTHDSFNIYESCKYFWLRSIDCMQGVIYGVHTDELAKNARLRTRLDYDEAFGTVVHRFVTQAVIGIPLTVYGSGEQIRGYIALEDAMECMVRLISSPPEPGQYEVVNQVSGVHKINDIVETVAKVAKDKFNIDVKIQRIDNPRVEAEEHPFEMVSKKLYQIFGFNPKVTLEEEITRIFSLIVNSEIKNRILEKKHIILPKITWRGDKVDADVLEVYNPNTKKRKGYQGKVWN